MAGKIRCCAKHPLLLFLKNLFKFTTLEKIIGFVQRRSVNICGFTTVRPGRSLRHRWKYSWLNVTKPWSRTGPLLWNCRLHKNNRKRWAVACLPSPMHTNWKLEMTRRIFLLTKGKCASSMFGEGSVEPFPRQSITARFNERKTYDLNLFCYCSMPKCSDYMVQCELCEEWLHMSCEGLKTAPEGEWLCTVCRPPDSKRLRNC